MDGLAFVALTAGALTRIAVASKPAAAHSPWSFFGVSEQSVL